MQDSVVSYGMVPIYGRDIEDGEYEVEVRSSSPYFRILDARLSVHGDEMECTIFLSSSSYLYVYPGRGEEAEKAGEASFIEFDNTDNAHTVTIPVEALNKALPLASFSKRREKWYDRDILIDAASLPEGALRIELPDYGLIEKAVESYSPEALITESIEMPEEGSAFEEGAPVRLELPDGEYSIRVDMTGGSGRAAVSSPTLLLVKEQEAYARLLWSSPNYDYMIVGGETYLNETEDGGNSVFTVPVTALDTPVPIIADTTAMGDPVAIEYELTFYGDTVGSKSQIPQEAAKTVLLMAVIIIAAGFFLNLAVKKRKERA